VIGGLASAAALIVSVEVNRATALRLLPQHDVCGQRPRRLRAQPNYAAQLMLDSLADLGSKVKVDIATAKRP
jgi:hypothetical protein